MTFRLLCKRELVTSACKQLLLFKNRLLVRSSLGTRGLALLDACQLRPDIALTELNNLIQLSRGSFAASV